MIHFHWDKRIKKSKLNNTTWGFNTEISTRLLLSNADYFNENMCVSHSYISSEFSWSPTHSRSLKKKGISFFLIFFFANLVFNWKTFALQNLVFFGHTSTRISLRYTHAFSKYSFLSFWLLFLLFKGQRNDTIWLLHNEKWRKEHDLPLLVFFYTFQKTLTPLVNSY